MATDTALAAAAKALSSRRDITKDPEWLELRGLIIGALQPYPEALRALYDALGEDD